MCIRPAWNVRPAGRSTDRSCSTTVLVEGTMTATFARHPVTSGIALDDVGFAELREVGVGLAEDGLQHGVCVLSELRADPAHLAGSVRELREGVLHRHLAELRVHHLDD